MFESISDFLHKRKADKLKASPGANSEKRENIEKKYDLDTWIPDAAKRAAQLYMASHPSTFSHPDAKIGSIIAVNQQASDGYLRTGNIAYELDVFGNAAALDVYKFLCLKHEDGQTVLQHLEQDSEAIKQFFSQKIPTVSYENSRSGFLALKLRTGKNQTDGWVKQVYFPVDTNRDTNPYHLLSILTPSGLLTQAKIRIDAVRFSEIGTTARKARRENQHHPEGFDDIPGLTVIKYGGTKPQNISVLNNQNAGRAYLLSSVPPTLTQRQVRLPTRNFFRHSLSIRKFQDSFQTLDRLMQNRINNIHIREGIRNTLNYLIDQVLQQALRIRASEPGWSNGEHYQNLPLEQRIWLDDAYIEQREQTDDWLEAVVNDFTRWIISAYETLCQQSHTQLSDDEFRELAALIKEALAADQEFFK